MEMPQFQPASDERRETRDEKNAKRTQSNDAIRHTQYDIHNTRLFMQNEPNLNKRATIYERRAPGHWSRVTIYVKRSQFQTEIED